MANYKDIKYQFPTSAVTSGTFADGRISESSVTQHAATVDLQPIKSDVTALALREATNEASAAFNLPNQFIETFTDDTNLGTQTDGDRTSGYWGTVYSSDTTTTNITLLDVAYTAGDRVESAIVAGVDNFFGNAFWVAPNTKIIVDEIYFVSHGVTGSNSGKMYLTTDNSNAPTVLTPSSVASGDSYAWSYSSNTQGSYVGGSISSVQTFDNLAGASNLRGWFMIGGFGSTFSTGMIEGKAVGGATTNDYYNPAGDNTATPMGTSINNTYTVGVTTDIASNESAGYKLVGDKVVRTPVISATGTLIQSANTVGSNKTKVGGTFLYKDNEGVATLGSANDLAIYFTCNGGTNWTEAASYNAITPVYSTGVKQVRLGETTCTEGTDVRYKAVWANQASGSKETQLHGIGINY